MMGTWTKWNGSRRAFARRFDLGTPGRSARVWSGVLVLAIPATLWAPAAQATFLFWNNASGGNAGTAANWSPSQVPVSNDYLFFDVPGTYTVTIGSSVPQVFRQHYQEGTVSLNVTTPHTVTNFISVEPDATLRFIGGNLDSGSLLVDGNTITGDAGTMEITGGSTQLTTGACTVGTDGSATLRILNGAYLLSTGDVILSYDDGPGTIVVGGNVGSDRSTLETDLGRDILVGRNDDATLSVTEGGRVLVDGQLDVACGPSSSGTITVEGTSVGGLLETQSHVYLGSEQCFVADAGPAFLHVKNKGTVNVFGIMFVGQASLGNAMVRVDTGGALYTESLRYQDETSFLDFRGGSLTIDGGQFDPPGTSLILNSTSGSPTLFLENGADLDLSSTASPPRALQVGTTGNGEIHVANGSVCTITAGTTVIGAEAGGFGSLTVESGGVFSEVSSIFCGTNGEGNLIVQEGGLVTAATVSAGLGSGQGFIDVIGAGSSINTVNFTVGGSTTAAGGLAVASLADGGNVTATSSSNLVKIWPAGALNVYTGATLAASGTIDHRGLITLGDGSITALALDFLGAAALEGTGTISGRVLADDPACTITASGGPLNLGKATDTQGFVNEGTLDVGGEVVTLLDSNGPRLGNVTMSTGTLTYTGTGTLQATKTMSGKGLIDADMINEGTISSIGAGLRFDGFLTGVGAGISGDLITFHDDGGFRGTGLVDCPVKSDAGSVIQPSGDLTLGKTMVSAGVDIGGILTVGPHQVTLRDADTVPLGTSTTLDGGKLAHAHAVLLSAGDVISGTGTIAASLTNGGTVAPGASAGQFTVTGSYINQAAGTLSIELGNHSISQWDVVAVSGSATLGGTLHVQPLPSFSASQNDEFAILTYGSRTGVFTNVVIDPFPRGETFVLEYRTNALVLVTDQSTSSVEPGIAEVLPTAFEFEGRNVVGSDPEFLLALPWPAEVRLQVFDITGRRVAVLGDGAVRAGWHRFPLDRAHDLAGGVYFARAEVASADARRTEKARVVVVR